MTVQPFILALKCKSYINYAIVGGKHEKKSFCRKIQQQATSVHRGYTNEIDLKVI